MKPGGAASTQPMVPEPSGEWADTGISRPEVPPRSTASPLCAASWIRTLWQRGQTPRTLCDRCAALLAVATVNRAPIVAHLESCHGEGSGTGGAQGYGRAKASLANFTAIALQIASGTQRGPRQEAAPSTPHAQQS